MPVKMLIDDIIVSVSLCYCCDYDANRRILVGQDRVLIQGKLTIEKYKAMGIKEVDVTIVDLEALLYEKQSVDQMVPKLLISERVAIGLRLEEVIDNYADLPL